MLDSEEDQTDGVALWLHELKSKLVDIYSSQLAPHGQSETSTMLPATMLGNHTTTKVDDLLVPTLDNALGQLPQSTRQTAGMHEVSTSHACSTTEAVSPSAHASETTQLYLGAGLLARFQILLR